MPSVRSSARGGRRGRGRGRGRGAAPAAAGARRKRAAVYSAAIGIGDDDTPMVLTKRRIQDFRSEADDSRRGPRDAPDEAADGSLNDYHVLKDISSGAVEGEVEAVMVSECTVKDGSKKSVSHRRSKRLQGKSTVNQDLYAGDTDDDIFENRSNSYDDEEEKIVPQRRSKRLRETYKSEHASGETSADKNTSPDSSNDDHDNLVSRRRSKRFGYKIGTQTIASDDEDDSDTLFHQRKVIPCRMSKRLQEKQKTNHISDESCIEASVLPGSSLSEYDELLHNSKKASTGTSGGPICSLCKSGTARSHLIRCQNSGCSSSFHTFCQNPPLQDDTRRSECSLCKINKAALANLTEENTMKRIEKIVGHRMVAIQECNFQYQFLVKWHSFSHHHDCWVPLEWLQVFGRLQIQSYLNKNKLLNEIYSEDQRKPEWFEVDRAIACRRKPVLAAIHDILGSFGDNKNFGDYEFLVKWKGLDYCEATWEPACTEEVQIAVSKLIERHQNTSKRIDCDSPECLGVVIPKEIHNGTLYDYQLQGLEWMLDNFKTRRNVILADEMGLGKTVQVVCFLSHIIKGSLTTFPALVLAPKSILLQWEKEFGHWGSSLNVIVYQGDKESRKCIQAHEMYSSEGKVLFDALVTSYEFVQIDKAVLQKIKWSTIVIDEAHRMKKLDCNLAACLKRYRSDFRLLLTGTPLQNNILELFSLLHYIDPDEFSDPKADGLFAPIETGKELTMEDKFARIHAILKPRMLRRMKSEVLTDSIPTKKWVEVPCALTDSQRELYIDILEKNYSKLNGAIKNGRKLALNNVLMELRKCCNHPYLFQGQETNQQAGDIFNSLVAASGKLQLLHKLLPRLKERGNRVLIFSQMTLMLDILEDFLFYLGYKYARIDGQTSLSARQESIKEYNMAESQTFIFLMSTRAGGLGVDLPGADRVIIYDPDFNPFMDLQAQSRAHRIGQTRPVVVYQLITKCSVEEKILQKSKQKLAIENILMNSSKKPNADELQSILLHGAKTIIDRKKVSATSIHYDDEAMENLLKLDPSAEEKCSTDDNGYLGSIVSFAHGADDEEPGSPKVEDLKILKPATPKVDLGRGKRQRRAVNYADAMENSDSDDMYAPEGSSSSSSSSDDNYDDEPETLTSGLTLPALEAPTGLHDAEPYNGIDAPVVHPAIQVPTGLHDAEPYNEIVTPVVHPAIQVPTSLHDAKPYNGIAALVVHPAIQAPTGLHDAEPYKGILAPAEYPALEAPKVSSPGSRSDDENETRPVPALEAPKHSPSSRSSSSDDHGPSGPSPAAEPRSGLIS